MTTKELKKNNIPPTLIQLLKEGTAIDKCNILETLVITGEKDHRKIIEKHLDNEDIDVSIAAIDALAEVGDKCSVPKLTALLLDSHDGEIKIAATAALGEIGCNDALPTLLTLASEYPENLYIDENSDWDDYWDIQLKAIKSLGKLKNAAAIPTLLRIITNKESQDLENEILQALIECGPPGIEAAYQQMSNSNTRTKQRIVKALRKSSSAIAIDKILLSLDDNEPTIRKTAIESLNKVSISKNIDRLSLLLNDPNDQVRLSCLTAIQNCTEKNIISYSQLEKLLSDTNDHIRKSALHSAFILVSDRQADTYKQFITTFIHHSYSEDIEEATTACKLLSFFNETEVTQRLEAILNNKENDPQLRREALSAIAKQSSTKNNQPVEIFKNAVFDIHQPVRFEALRFLCQMHTETSNKNENHINSFKPIDFLLSVLNGKAELHNNTDSHLIPLVNIDDDILSITKGNNNENNVETLNTTHAKEPQEKTQKKILSTLESISLSNTESALIKKDRSRKALSTEEMIQELPSQYQQFAQLINKKKQLSKRPNINHALPLSIKNDTRHVCARLLGDIPDIRVINALIALTSDNQASLRCEAIHALIHLSERHPQAIGLENTFETLNSRLQDSDAEVRRASAKALGLIPFYAGFNALLNTLNDADTSVRIATIDGVVNLMKSSYYLSPPIKSPHSKPKQKDIAALLRIKLSDSAYGVRNAAVNALMTFKNSQYLNDIIAMATADGSILASQTGKKLRNLPPEVSLPALEQALKKSDSSNKRQAIIHMIREVL